MTAKRQVSLTLGVDNLEFIRMSWKQERRVPPRSLWRTDELREPLPQIPPVIRKEFPSNFHRERFVFNVPFL